MPPLAPASLPSKRSRQRHVADYEQYCKPKLARLLQALGLDTPYVAASGMHLVDSTGERVTDFVGGFGSLMLGHNSPELSAHLISTLKEQVAVHAQATVSREAGELAQKLNELLPCASNYRVTFSNSGAESVEAALKHAYKQFVGQVDAKMQVVERASAALARELTSAGRFDEASKQRLVEFRERNRAIHKLLSERPIVLAARGSYHGKTGSTLKVTSSPFFREPFAGLSGVDSRFLTHHELANLDKVLDSHTRSFSCPVLRSGKIAEHEVLVPSVVALVLEVVQGEAGVFPISDDVLSSLVHSLERTSLPLIVDEVQTGCGRLGAFYGFSLTALGKIDPHYITLSKALGGGLTKIGATLIRNDVYDEDFGLQHTSTFGEDGLALKVASKAVDLLSDATFLATVRERGSELKEALQQLSAEFPDIVKDIRGRGLMLAVEFHRLEGASPFFRSLSETSALVMFIASYLRRYHALRVFCPLNSLMAHGRVSPPNIMRIQPPALVKSEHIEQLVRGLREVLTVIRANNEYSFTAHLLGREVPRTARTEPKKFSAILPRSSNASKADKLCAFVAHSTSTEMLMDALFPSFIDAGVGVDEFEHWWKTLSEFVEPVWVRSEFTPISGQLIRSDIIMIPYLPSHIQRLKQDSSLKKVQEKIEDAVCLAQSIAEAEKLPLASLGLGAFTSIATDNGELFSGSPIPITTGNGYATALTAEAVLRIATMRGIPLESSKVAIVGASGNIGSVLAEFFSERCRDLVLIGRPGGDSIGRLNLVRRGCLRSLLSEVKKESKKDLPTLSALRAAGQVLASRGHDGHLTWTGQQLDQYGDELAEAGVVRFHLEIELTALKEVDVLILATDSTDSELIRPDMLKPGVIVCCASVPTNLSRSFLNDDTRTAFDGGLARLPGKGSIDYPGFPANGLSYGCHCEALMIAAEGPESPRSVGKLTLDNLESAWSLAKKHRFQLGALRLHEREIVVNEKSDA